MPLKSRFAIVAIASLAISPFLAGFVGGSIGKSILHPARLNPMRLEDTQKMLTRTGARKEEFDVLAKDGIVLKGWKVRPNSYGTRVVKLFEANPRNR